MKVADRHAPAVLCLCSFAPFFAAMNNGQGLIFQFFN